MLAEDVEKLVKKIHAFQFDKVGVEYYKHPIWVKNQLPIWASEDLKNAALLHDALEDTKITEQQLRDLGISDRTLQIINSVTHDRNMSYDEYINKIIESDDLDVIVLKYTDMKHNLLESRLALLNERMREKLLSKYSQYFEKLKDKLSEIKNRKSEIFNVMCEFHNSNSCKCFEDCDRKQEDGNGNCKFEGKCTYTVKEFLEEKYKNIENELDKIICMINDLDDMLSRELDVCEYCNHFRYDDRDDCFYFGGCSRNWEDICADISIQE